MSDDENKLIAERRAKLDKLRSGGGTAFPNDFRRDALADHLLTAYGDRPTEWFDKNTIRVKVGGRMLAKRVMGKASFAKIADRSGQIQVFAQGEALGASYDDFKGWDVGDLIGVEGVLFKTKTGELTVKAEKLRLLTKSLRPLPDKWHGLADQEIRYRQRYVDLIVNPQSAQVFKTRTRIIKYLRDFLDAMDFLEVETPMMQAIAGGAVARPFVTHHNALDMQLYLRIAPELFLKRLLVGGFERVYEINRNFRNEGISTRHNPEFTMLELYQAYRDFSDFMSLVERMCQGLCDTVLGTRRVEYQGEVYDFAQPFRRGNRELYQPGRAHRAAEIQPQPRAHALFHLACPVDPGASDHLVLPGLSLATKGRRRSLTRNLAALFEHAAHVRRQPLSISDARINGL